MFPVTWYTYESKRCESPEISYTVHGQLGTYVILLLVVTVFGRQSRDFCCSLLKLTDQSYSLIELDTKGTILMHTRTPPRRLWEAFNHAVITARMGLLCVLIYPPLVKVGYINRKPIELKQCEVNETDQALKRQHNISYA